MGSITNPSHASLSALSKTLVARQWKLAVAESCTGGMLSEHITSIAGSSEWFDCGFITYSNEAKIRLLDVHAALIEAHGAVSEAVAKAMAEGVLANSQSQLSVAITGIAGPAGGSVEKPVGTVCFAWASETNATISSTLHFDGDRREVREQAVLAAVDGLSMLILRATN